MFEIISTREIATLHDLSFRIVRAGVINEYCGFNKITYQLIT
jgi:hypothetical protein